MTPIFQMGERESLSRAVMAGFSVLVKAKPDGDRRLVEIEASVEKEDAEGDLILQAALLGSADKFVKTGHLDCDHFSELPPEQTGIMDPESWIVGRPLKVWGGPGKSTMVQGELFKSIDGTFNPDRNKYDALWASLISTPPVLWRASVFGYMAPDTVDCREQTCPGGPARFLVKHFDWCSLAFTRSPVNQSISSFARVVSAKAFISGLEKGKSSLDGMYCASQPLSTSPSTANHQPPAALVEVEKSDFTNSPTRASMQHIAESSYCAKCNLHFLPPNLPAFKGHFAKCAGFGMEDAELLAHAAMYKTLLNLARKGVPNIYGPGNDSLDERDKKSGQRGSPGN